MERVINAVQPVVDERAIEAARIDAEQRAAAIQREEDARRVRDSAVTSSFLRAPDRLPVDAVIDDPDAPQVTPDIPPSPFTAVGLDQTALRTYEAYGVKLSDSTQRELEKLNEEEQINADAGRDMGGMRLSATDDASDPNREPDEIQGTQTTQSNQPSEPNMPNQPDKPSDSTTVNEPGVREAGVSVSGANVSGDESGGDSDYDSMTVKDLRSTVEERGVEVKSDARKADLIAALEENDAK